MARSRKNVPPLINQLTTIETLIFTNRDCALTAVDSLESILGLFFYESYNYKKITKAEKALLKKVINDLSELYGQEKFGNLAAKVALLKARFATRRCDTDEALKLYQQAEKDHPYFWQTYKFHALLLENLDRTDEAASVKAQEKTARKMCLEQNEEKIRKKKEFISAVPPHIAALFDIEQTPKRSLSYFYKQNFSSLFHHSPTLPNQNTKPQIQFTQCYKLFNS